MKKFGKKAIFIIVAIIGIYLILWLLELLIVSIIQTKSYQKFALLLAIAFFGILLFLLNSLFIKEDTKVEFEREINYLKQNFSIPLFWGAGIALIFIAGTAFFFENIDGQSFIRSNIFGISGILLSIISTIILFRSIFQEIAPISSIERFLNIASEDIKEKRFSRSGRVILVYPAINIGYYREQIDEVPAQHYSDFITALNFAKDNTKIDFTLITYPVSLYKPLYEKYGEMNFVTDVANDLAIQNCITEATNRFNDFNSSTHTNCKTFEVQPQQFPSHCLIVDNTVYLINTFGLPEYNYSDCTFFSPNSSENTKEKLAKAYIYKQEDKILADLLIEKITTITNEKES
ncbi:MAG: hypothetical protein H6553_12205 [Chitinophagales bacterium]|nr:hypothetical protein [Chitinophagales bacterium]